MYVCRRAFTWLYQAVLTLKCFIWATCVRADKKVASIVDESWRPWTHDADADVCSEVGVSGKGTSVLWKSTRNSCDDIESKQDKTSKAHRQCLNNTEPPQTMQSQHRTTVLQTTLSPRSLALGFTHMWEGCSHIRRVKRLVGSCTLGVCECDRVSRSLSRETSSSRDWSSRNETKTRPDKH